MGDVNDVRLEGRVSQEVKRMGKGPVQWGMAISVTAKKIDFVDVKYWVPDGEEDPKLEKGDRVEVRGAIRTDTWEKEGKKIYRTFVYANQWRIVRRDGMDEDEPPARTVKVWDHPESRPKPEEKWSTKLSVVTDHDPAGIQEELPF